jgi:hypothetical protein
MIVCGESTARVVEGATDGGDFMGSCRDLKLCLSRGEGIARVTSRGGDFRCECSCRVY